MSPLATNEMSIKFEVDGNCNNCCPGLCGKHNTPKDAKKIKISDPKIKTDEKISKTCCVIV